MKDVAIPSISTISRHLKAFGRPSRSPSLKCGLSDTHKLARYMWAKDHQHWDDHWNSVIFSDESTFQLHNNSMQFVRRPKGKRYFNKYVHSKFNPSVASVNVWAAMSSKGISKLHFITGRLDGHRYVNEILDGALKQYCNEFFHDNNNVFQHDTVRDTHLP